ncbi:MAG TPA: asparagine synthetase B, partial [Acidimicrobiia bacterium]
MCGIAGFVAAGLGSEDALQSLVTRMAEALGHRGPDDSGFWTDAAAGVALGHRRLKVIDLSAGGSQPMISHSGRLVLTYNGEIYNYKEIRKELESKHQRFRSESDTEVLLGAIEVWGIHEALLRVNGMFAFGVWDRSERSLILARDRFGEKP